MENQKNLLSIGKAAEYLNISIDTLRRWEKKGKVESYRSPGNHRYFLKEDLDTLFGKKYQHDSFKKNTKKKPKKEMNSYDINTKSADKNENIVSESIKATSYAPIVYPIFTPTSTTQEEVIDRPAREVRIPEVELIRVIQEKKMEISTDGIQETKKEQVESSILTPTSIEKEPEQKPKEVVQKEALKPKQEKVKERESTSEVIKNNLLIYAVITVTILIVIATIFFFVGVTSQKMITPVP